MGNQGQKRNFSSSYCSMDPNQLRKGRRFIVQFVFENGIEKGNGIRIICGRKNQTTISHWNIAQSAKEESCLQKEDQFQEEIVKKEDSVKEKDCFQKENCIQKESSIEEEEASSKKEEFF